MKLASTLMLSAMLSAATVTAGCARVPVQVFEYDTVRLEVSGRVVPAGHYVAAADLDPAVYASIDFREQQVLIEAKLLSTSRSDQSILGIDWWPGEGAPIQPVHVGTTTEKPMPITLGFGFGGGIGGGDDHRTSTGHPANCRCEQCRATRGGNSSGGGFGIGVPLTMGGDNRTTSVRATFDLPGTVAFDQSYIVVLVQVGTTNDAKILAQPLLLPVTKAPSREPKPDASQPKEVTSLVVVRDGQTLALGGLLSEDEARAKVPALSNVPLLGRLFASDTSLRRNKDLVIFVTPRVTLQTEE